MKDSEKKDFLILGIGNVLLRDEGIGVHAIKELETLDWPENVDLLDGGTGGFHILSLVQEYKTIIMIDATLDSDTTGTIKVLKPKFSKDFPKALSSHDIGLKDLIDSAILLDSLPRMYLITVTIRPEQDVNMELSPEIQKTIPGIIKEVLSLLNSLNTNAK